METDSRVYFKRGYKYQVSRPYHIKLDIVPYDAIDLDFIRMDMEGNLLARPGYAWNGASGPTWDTLNSMRGSLTHDILYQLIRLGYIESDYKEYADQVLYDLCVEDGMYKWRASYWRWAVLKFGAGSCKPSAEPKEEVAP
ncbi:MAG: hypothetical protein WC372_08970 [Candidatus Neomarinimicrobiota bacterium]